MFFICLNNFYLIIFSSFFLYLITVVSFLLYSLYDFKKLNKTITFTNLSLSPINKIMTITFFMVASVLLNVRSHNIFIFFGHIIVSTNVLSVLLVFVALFLIVLNCYKTFFSINSLESAEHVILLFNFFLIVPLLSSVSSLISLIVLIELVSIIASLLIVNGFACSSFIFKNKTIKTFSSTFNKDMNILYSLIINFWVSLGSSLLFFISILVLFSSFFTSDISVIAVLAPSLNSINKLNNLSWALFFVMGVFLKIALPPVFFWKIVFFKNLPNHILFFYVNVFFASIFFILLLIILGNSVFFTSANLLATNAVILFGFFTSVSFMLNMLNFKIFVAFSSTFNLLMLVLISINASYCILV